MSIRTSDSLVTSLVLQNLSDGILMMGVATLVAIDLTILVVYTLVEGIRGKLVITEVPHKEQPQIIEGVSTIITQI